GDDANSPRYIETLPRHGYRFIPLPVVHADVAAAPQEVSAPNAQPTTASMASGCEQASENAKTSSPANKTAPVRRPRLQTLTLIPPRAMVPLLAGVYAFWRARSGTSVSSVRLEAPSQSGPPANVATTSAAGSSPPLHSIAVLPFVNMSG